MISAHLLPNFRCASKILIPSSKEIGPLLMSGLRWLFQRSRICFPLRSIIPYWSWRFFAITDHLFRSELCYKLDNGFVLFFVPKLSSCWGGLPLRLTWAAFWFWIIFNYILKINSDTIRSGVRSIQFVTEWNRF